MNEKNNNYKDFSAYVDSIQAGGKYCFRKKEAVNATGLSESAVVAASKRLINKTRLVMPRQGFYVIVPLEYKSAGSPPPSWFIDQLMKYIGETYYVGLLTASSYYGAAHQQPQEFQVVTKTQVRSITIARIRIRFVSKKSMERTEINNIKTETGTMRISSPEETAFDIVRYMHLCGTLDNVATVLSELAEQFSPEKLFKAAKNNVKLSSIQRFGFIMEELGHGKLVASLADLVKHIKKPILLAQKLKRMEYISNKWRVVKNKKIEAEI